MVILFGAWTAIASVSEHQANPAVQAAGQTYQPNGNTTGKEVRFGVPESALFGVASTQTSTGSANSAYDSFTPIGGGALLTGMMIGEVTPGGVGSGLYTILIYAVIAVFIGGLMVGRTPEYLGKKIQATEVKLAGLGTLVMPVIVLVFTGIAVSLHAGRAGPLNGGPHGFTEILYALTSQGNNNGSAFGGLTGDTTFYNVVGGVDMLIGRFGIMIPAIALGGVLAAKKVVPAGAGTFRTDNAMFIGLLIGVIIIVGGLTFFPAVSLGPIVEQLSHRPVLSVVSGPIRHLSLGGLLRPSPPPALPPRTRAHTGSQSPAACSTARFWKESIAGAFTKLDPRVQVRNPVMFVVLIGTVITFIESVSHSDVFNWSITVWLFLTVLFANFAEAMAEGRGKAQASALRKMRSEATARRLRPDGSEEIVPASALMKGDRVVAEAGDLIPSDGEIIEGIASVDESAITGESAPVIRESGGDRSAVTGGTTVLSDRIVVEITAEPGHTFLDRMITLVEGANRQKTPERDRPHHSAGRPHHHLPAGRGGPAALRPLLRGQRLGGHPGLAAGLPDPHDHRRAALGHRHRRHGPAGAAQRAWP